jgi:hypothetical protein
MSDQLVSWLRDTAEVLSLIGDNLHDLQRILWELTGITAALGSLVYAWRRLLHRCKHGKRAPRTKG